MEQTPAVPAQPSVPIEQIALITEPVTLTEDPGDVEAQVRAAFPDAPLMVSVARAESQFIPTAHNPHSSATGVFQILTGTWSAYHCTGTTTVAADNIRCARAIYNDSGTAPWNSSKSSW